MAAKLIEVETVKPFMFPCQECGSYKMHKLYSQKYGLMIGIPFMEPLGSTHKGFHVVCMTCTTINGQIKKDQVAALEGGKIPKMFHEADEYLHEFYSPGYFDEHKAELTEGMDKEDASYLEKTIKHYALET